MKKCNKCNGDGPFYADRSAGDGFRNICQECDRKARNARREKMKAKNSATPPPMTLQDVVKSQVPAVDLPQFDIDVVEPPAPTPLEQAYEERQKQKDKLQTKQQRDALLEENDQLKAEIEELKKFRKPPEIIVYEKAAWLRSDAVACAVASDWHIEEPVESDTVHGLNEYNLDIAKSRAEYFFKNFLRLAEIMAKDTKITTLYLAGLGDFFSGWIHPELMANGLLAPGDAARFCKGLWFSGIDYLLKESSFILEGDFVPGNHGRMTQQMHFGNPTGTSLESVMYDSIVDRYYDNPRVQFNVSKQAMVYRRFFEKFNMRLIHGYEVKYGGGVGGLTIPLRKALAQWNNPIRADLTVLGHFHQFFDGGDFLVNGSLIGYNLFAQAIKASYEEAKQAFFLVHARGGGEKSITAPIWLDGKHHGATGLLDQARLNTHPEVPSELSTPNED